MGTFARLKDGNLLLEEEIDERLPKITEGLVAHYPFDFNPHGRDYNGKRNLLNTNDWKYDTYGDQGKFSAFKDIKTPATTFYRDGQYSSPEGVTFSPDGKYIVTTNNSDTGPNICLYKLEDNQIEVVNTFSGIKNPYRIEFTPDGQYLIVTCADEDFSIVLLKRYGDTLVTVDTHKVLNSAGNDISISSDSKYVVITAEIAPHVILLKIEDDHLVSVATYIIGSRTTGCHFSPNDEYIVISHYVSSGNTVTILKRDGDELVFHASTDVGNTASSAVFSPDGQYIAVTRFGDPCLVILSFNGEELAYVTDYNTSGNGAQARFSPDGKYIGFLHAGSPRFTILEFKDGDILSPHNPGGISVTARGIKFSPDGQYIAVVRPIGSTEYSFYIYKFTSSYNNNKIVKATNPFNYIDNAWEIDVKTVTEKNGGWEVFNKPIDSTKTYRFSVWFRKDLVGDGVSYFGPQPLTVSDLNDNEPIADPYFVNILNDTIQNMDDKWLLLVAHIHPYNYSGGKHPDTGIYDTTGTKIYSDVNDFKWVQDISYGGNRVYLKNSTTIGEKEYLYRPRMEVLDDTSPKLIHLLNDMDDIVFIPEEYNNENITFTLDGVGVHEPTENLLPSPLFNEGTELFNSDPNWSIEQIGDISLKLSDTYTLPNTVYGVSFSPDGKYIAIGHNGSPYFTLLKRNGDNVELASNYTLPSTGQSVSFYPDGQYIAVGHEGPPYFTLLKRNGDNVELASTYTLPGIGRSVSFSPDGQYIAVGHHYSPRFTLLKRNGDNVKLASTYTLPNYGFGVSFSPDGQYIAVGHEGSPFFTLLRLNGGIFGIKVNHDIPAIPWDISFSPDDKYIAVAHENGTNFTLLQLDSDQVNLATEIQMTNNKYAAVFSPDGQYLVVAGATSNASSDPRLRLYKVNGSTLTYVSTYSFSATIRGVRFSPDGEYIAVGYNESPYFTLLKRTGDTLSIASTHTLPGGGRRLCFSPDGKYIAVSTTVEPYLILLKRDGPTVTIVATYTTPSSINDLDFSPDGKYIALAHGGSPYLTILKRDGDSLSVAYTYTLSYTGVGVKFSPDGNFVGVGCWNSPYFYLFKRNREVLTRIDSFPVDNPVRTIAFSNNGEYIALGVTGSNTPHFVALKNRYGVRSKSKRIMRFNYNDESYSQSLVIKDNKYYNDYEKIISNIISEGFNINDYVTFSAYVKTNVSNKVKLAMVFLDSEGNELSSHESELIETTNKFERLYVTAQVPENTQYIKLMAKGIEYYGEYMEVYLPQFETKPFMTSMTPGTRGNPKFKVPAKIKPPFTIHIDFTPSAPNDIEKYIVILSADSLANKLLFWKNAESDQYRIRISGSNTNDFILPKSVSQGSRSKVAIIVGEEQSKVYVNGQLISTKNIPLTFDWIEYLDLAGYDNYLAVPNSEIHSLSIYDKELSEKEVIDLSGTSESIKIEKNSNLNATISERPLYIPEDAYYWPLSDNTLDETLMFDAVNKENLKFRDGYAWVSIAATKNFTLYEDTDDFPEKFGSKFETVVFEEDTVIYRYNFKGEYISYRGHNYFMPQNSSYYFAVDVYVSPEYNGTNDIFVKFQASGGVGVNLRYDLNKKGTWQRLYLHIPPVTSSDGITSRILLSPCDSDSTATKGYILFKNPIMTDTYYEIPFSKDTLKMSSLEFNLYEEIGLRWDSEWTIMYWKIPIGTQHKNLTGYNIESLGSNGNSVGGGYIWWGKTSSKNAVAFSPVSGDDRNFNIDDYFNKPHFVALVRTTSGIKCKLLGIGDTSYEFISGMNVPSPNYFVCQHGYDLKLGGYGVTSGTGRITCSSMYRNLIAVKRALNDNEIDRIYKSQMSIKSGKIYIPGTLTEGVIL